MMTRQEIFNIVFTGLHKQGWVRSVEYVDGMNTCMYRSPEGNKCAFGHLIPDEVYDPCIENILAYNLIASEKSAVSFPAFKKWADENISISDYGFIDALQKAHDRSHSPEEMMSVFKIISINYSVNIPEEK